jgi:hypothetical protein
MGIAIIDPVTALCFPNLELGAVCFGSLADMSGCEKMRPLCLGKQTFYETTEKVRYVPLTDMAPGHSNARR